MNAPRLACVEGIAIWSPGLPGWEMSRAAFAGGTAPRPAPMRRPSPDLLPAAERRRAPDSVALAIEVAAAACCAAGRDPATLPSVFATTHGDLAITDALCETLVRAPLETSPTRFHNSVHNAAAGYWCIGNGCHAPYTTVSVDRYTFGAGLLEALTQVIDTEQQVLFVAYDIESRGPLVTLAPSRGLLGAGLVLGARPTGRTVARLSWSIGPGDGAAPTSARPELAELAGGNAIAGCLPLYEILARGGRARLALAPDLLLDLAVAEAAAA